MRLSEASTGSCIRDDEIHAFVDDVLDDARRNELLAHIAAHPHEAERVGAYFRQRAVLSALRIALSDDDDAALCLDLQQRLEASLRRQRGFRVMLRLAAAVAVLLPLGAGSWLAASHLRGASVEQVASSQVPSLGAEFPFGAALEMAHLGDVAGERNSMHSMVLQLEELSITVPDWVSLGLTLLAIDTVPDVTPPAMRLVYTDEQGNRLLLFIAPVSSSASPAIMVVPEGHLSLSWRGGSWMLALVAPTQMPRLLDVMQHVSQSSGEAETMTEAASVEAAPALTPDATIMPDPPVEILPADQTSIPLTPVTGEIAQEHPKAL